MTQLLLTISERLQARDTTLPVKGHSGDLSEVVIVSQSAARRWQLVATIRDILRLKTQPLAGFVRSLTLRSAIKVTSADRLGYSATLRSIVRVTSSQGQRLGTRIAEAIKIRQRHTAAATYSRRWSSLVELIDGLNRPGLYALLRSAAGIGDAAGAIYRAVAGLRDRVEITPELGYTLQIVVVTQDGVELTDSSLLQMLYSGHLSDIVEMVIDVADPSGETTTWAMNVRTGAVTEYLDFDFNAFTKGQNGLYLGAADDGLYELAGPDDAGTPVPFSVVSGLADFSGSYLSGMKAVYLGLRGSGEYFLRLTGASGRSSTYGVKATSLRTARVNVGKGLRERFYTWELFGLGPDFDLIDVTFLPIQQTRRI